MIRSVRRSFSVGCIVIQSLMKHLFEKGKIGYLQEGGGERGV